MRVALPSAGDRAAPGRVVGTRQTLEVPADGGLHALRRPQCGPGEGPKESGRETTTDRNTGASVMNTHDISIAVVEPIKISNK